MAVSTNLIYGIVHTDLARYLANLTRKHLHTDVSAAGTFCISDSTGDCFLFDKFRDTAIPTSFAKSLLHSRDAAATAHQDQLVQLQRRGR